MAGSIQNVSNIYTNAHSHIQGSGPQVHSRGLVSGVNRPFRVLGLQQVAVGAERKQDMRTIWQVRVRLATFLMCLFAGEEEDQSNAYMQTCSGCTHTRERAHTHTHTHTGHARPREARGISIWQRKCRRGYSDSRSGTWKSRNRSDGAHRCYEEPKGVSEKWRHTHTHGTHTYSLTHILSHTLTLSVLLSQTCTHGSIRTVWLERDHPPPHLLPLPPQFHIFGSRLAPRAYIYIHMFVCVCMCVCMFKCVCMCVCAGEGVCVWESVCVGESMCERVSVRVCGFVSVFMCVFVCGCLCASVCLSVYLSVCVCVSARIYIHMYMYVQTYT